MDEIGICSWTLGLDDKPAELMARVRAMGLDGLQYCGRFDRVDPVALRRHAQDEGLTLFAIDPFDCAPPQGSDAGGRGAVAFYRQAVDFAAASGAAAVTLQGLEKWTQSCPSQDAAWQQLVETCGELATYARSRAVQPLYEVCNRYEASRIRTATQCQALFAALEAPRPGLILDSFHMNIDEVDPCRTLQANADDLAIYHVSDSNRGGIGFGHVDFAAQHRALCDIGFRGPVMFEFVLQRYAPVTPPRDGADMQEIERHVARSLSAWRDMQRAAAGAGEP